MLLAGALGAQSRSGIAPSGGGDTSPGSGAAAVQAAQGVLAQQSQGAGSSGQNNFKGSVVEGKATDGVLDLSLSDAIQRGLKTNLGLILETSSVKEASGKRLQELQALLPTAHGEATYNVQQVNLAAYGLSFPGFNPIVGPFQVFDFRAYLSQSVVNVQSLENYIAAKHNFSASKLTAEDARDMVTLTVGNAYLLCVADAARVESVQAQVNSSKVSLDQATAAHDAGTSPKLDVLRAQVDYQNQQQLLISAKNDLAKDMLALARTIGMPLEQQFRLTDTSPFQPMENLNAEAAFQQALKTRKDLAAAEETLKGAGAEKTAAWAQQLPAVSVSGDYGVIGPTLSHLDGTYTVSGNVKAPILQIAKTKGDVEVADASLQTARAQLSDKVQQVNQDIRTSILDIQSAAKLVEATHTNVETANEALLEAQERFKAGVSDNLAVSQAQSQAAQANDQYISALYQHNLAKLELARALGVAQTNYKDYVGGK
ncbi:TolC family protein [Terriglobus tenax]|uniref:TolC family protein n=1 Tax=Terriglobus tenax TaxID=1111115 RepID=UPI0021E04643|nr:TolC family protein [Terriglobus tenax]